MGKYIQMYKYIQSVCVVFSVVCVCVCVSVCVCVCMCVCKCVCCECTSSVRNLESLESKMGEVVSRVRISVRNEENLLLLRTVFA